jgi:hypothetical protein
MARHVVRVHPENAGWSVADDAHRDHLGSKEEAIFRAKQRTLGENRARIVVMRHDGSVEREFQIGRPSLPSPQ